MQINRERSEDDVQRTIDVFNRLHEGDEGFANVVERFFWESKNNDVDKRKEQA